MANQEGATMTKEAFDYAVSLGREIQKKENDHTVKTICGETYVFHNGECDRYREHDKTAPDRFTTFSLQGLVDYIESDVDGFFQDTEKRHIVRVTDTKTVEVLSPIGGVDNKRLLIAKCEAVAPGFPFDRYFDSEEFGIAIQTRIMQTENRDLVLALVGNMREEQSMETADDGFSQKVTMRKGVATVGDVVVKNPVTLMPRRIFAEVEQPESPFILRFAEGGKVALFEADGGAWKIEAVSMIRDWLKEKLEDCNVEVIA